MRTEGHLAKCHFVCRNCCLLHSAGHGFLLCLRLYLQLSKIKQKDFFDRACRAISSRRLVPGDVIVVLPGKATCDMVLLQGNCLVEESVLSGEVLTHLKPGHTVVLSSVAMACIGCAACPFDQQPNWKHRPFCLKDSAFCKLAWQQLSILPPRTFLYIKSQPCVCRCTTVLCILQKARAYVQVVCQVAGSTSAQVQLCDP